MKATFVILILFLTGVMRSDAQRARLSKGDENNMRSFPRELRYDLKLFLRDNYYPAFPDSLMTMPWEKVCHVFDLFTRYEGGDYREDAGLWPDAVRNDEPTMRFGLTYLLGLPKVVMVSLFSSAFYAGLCVGDTIVSINGRPVGRNLQSASSVFAAVPIRDSVHMVVTNGGFLDTLHMLRSPVVISDLDVARSERCLSILLCGFPRYLPHELWRVAESGNAPDTVVLDLRGNGGGNYHEGLDVAKMFLHTNDTVCIFSTREESKVMQADMNGPFASGKHLFVLVDSRTASTAELVAGALKGRRNVTIIGDTTYGKAIVQTKESFRGIQVWYTIGEVWPRDGVRIQGQGVIPDVLRTDDCLLRAGDRAKIVAARKASAKPSFEVLRSVGLPETLLHRTWPTAEATLLQFRRSLARIP